jgi:hypothetical protein
MDWMLAMESKDWMIVFATVLGPILAVQAQKALEAYRERGNRKKSVFSQLMATRASRLSPDHVRALNTVDLVFYGRYVLGARLRSKNEQTVLDSWKEYLDHLNTKPAEAAFPLWVTTSDELFVNLLYSMAQDVGYRFDRVQLKKGAYLPIAHDQIDSEQTALRRAALDALSGKVALNMNVVGFPMDEAATAAHRDAVKKVGVALEGGVLKVSVQGEGQQQS